MDGWMHAWMDGRAGEWVDRHPVYMNGWMEPLTLENSRICRKEKIITDVYFTYTIIKTSAVNSSYTGMIIRTLNIDLTNYNNQKGAAKQHEQKVYVSATGARTKSSL